MITAFYHKFRGKRYRVKLGGRGAGAYAECNGWCASPSDPAPVLRLYDVPTRKKRMEAAVHEAIHAGLWDISEESVEELGADIAAYLIKLEKRGWI